MNNQQHIVKRYRKSLNLGQIDFGKIFGLTQAQVSYIENNKISVPCEVVIAILADSEVDVDLSELSPKSCDVLGRVAIYRVNNNLLPANRGETGGFTDGAFKS